MVTLFYFGINTEIAFMKVGDQIEFVNHQGGGVITKISDNIVWVEMTDGLEIYCGINEVYKSQISAIKKVNRQSQKNKNTITNKNQKDSEINWEEKKPVFKKVKDKDFHVHPSIIGESAKPLNKENQTEIRWVIDLHIEEIIDDYRRLSNGEILEIQLKKFHQVIQDALKKKIKRLIVIHGVGKGVLKNEIMKEVCNYNIISIHDAPYLEFGKGATELVLSTQ
jgi:hypothetical protein